MKSTPTLYGNVESANTYKITLFFSLAREEFHFRTIDIFAGESRREEFIRDTNRFGEIPVLEHEGERIVQSAVILSYLAESCQTLAGETARERREIMEWLIWDTQRLSGSVAVYRHRARPKSSSLASTIAVAHPDPAIDAFFLARVEQALSLLDRHLAQHAFLVAEHPTIADVGVCAYLFPLGPPSAHIALTRWPKIEAWLGRIAGLPGWRSPRDAVSGASEGHS